MIRSSITRLSQQQQVFRQTSSKNSSKLTIVQFSNGKLSQTNISGKDFPPRQPTVVTSPVQKLKSGEKNQGLTLRLVQTPAETDQRVNKHGSVASFKSMRAGGLYDLDLGFKDAGRGPLSRCMASNSKHLATVSSHRSCRS